MRLGPAPISTPFAPNAPIPQPWQLYFRDSGKVLQGITSASVVRGFRASVHGNLVFVQYNGDQGGEFTLPASPVTECWIDRLDGATASRVMLAADAKSVTLAPGACIVSGWYMIDTDRPDQRR